MPPDWTVFLIGIAIVLIGVWLLAWSFRLRREMRESVTWPSVPGEILKCELIVFGAGSPKNYNVDLAYRYTVDGREHRGHEPHLYGITTKAEAESIVERFPEGATVDVYYSPARLDRAVLVTGERPAKKSHEMWMGIIVTIVGAIVAGVHTNGFLEALGGLLD